MAFIGISVTKRVAFRDSTQELSNVYHYTWTGLNPNAAMAETALDNVIAIEKPKHGNTVSFVHGRVWSAGGSIAENQMIFQKALTGVGAVPADVSIDRERALLIQWPAGVDSRGHPVTLKKWYHLCATALAGASLTDNIRANLSGFASADRTTQAAAFEPLRALAVDLITMNLCAASGRLTTGPAFAHKYLEHHQLGDQWRG